MNFERYVKDRRLVIIAKPNSPKNEITGYDESRQALRVSIKAPPENNKANLELIKFFSKLSGKDVKIISGMTGKKKTLLLM